MLHFLYRNYFRFLPYPPQQGHFACMQKGLQGREKPQNNTAGSLLCHLPVSCMAFELFSIKSFTAIRTIVHHGVSLINMNPPFTSRTLWKSKFLVKYPMLHGLSLPVIPPPPDPPVSVGAIAHHLYRVPVHKSGLLEYPALM